ncbi:MBL fold metallo-hydrolase [Succinatimonas hippei]|uniref:MBL fold metallo-hydrolase n=1 Tax=Succinatimonas hippei TaxID=626938 RepID=UPI00248F826F|nr:MBL fold metallo-hydrolase [Succinatimonas hippei]
MKIIICDVGNAACAIVTSSTGYTMMIDCGCHADKINPVEIFKSNKKWLGAKNYVTQQMQSYPIALLHITHPDDDHVRNAMRIKNELTPYLLCRNRYEEFSDGYMVNSDYVRELDKPYRGSNPEYINWGVDVNIVEKISVQECQANINLKNKERNNSSILRYVKEDKFGILFCGDLEKAGWDYLIEYKKDFISDIKNNGVNVLVAPHHGHKSGFPTPLFDIIGNVDVVIHSKDTEANKDGTDVSTQYSLHSNGCQYKSLNDNHIYLGKVLTTRSNGNIYIASNDTNYNVWTDKASSNHKCVL